MQTRDFSTTSHTDTYADRSIGKLEKRTQQEAATKSALRNDTPGSNGEDNPVLFISINTGFNESIARTITPGINDELTFQCLRETYQSISPGWCRLKLVTGIKFYRVHSKNRPYLTIR
jgi:hypothetical protein